MRVCKLCISYLNSRTTCLVYMYKGWYINYRYERSSRTVILEKNVSGDGLTLAPW